MEHSKGFEIHHRGKYMANNNIVLGISVIIVVFAFFFYLVYSYEKKRSKALQTEASRLGFNFEKLVSDESAEKYLSFHLASLGKDEGLMNRMWGEQDEYNISIFEHKYTMPSGEGSSATKHTVIAFETKTESLPSFSLTPKDNSQQLAGLIGGAIESLLGTKSKTMSDYKEITLKSNTDFTEKHQLKGVDEAALQQFFTSEVIALLEQDPDLYIENQGGIFLGYYKSERFKAKELSQFIEKIKNLRQAFSKNIEIKLEL